MKTERGVVPVLVAFYALVLAVAAWSTVSPGLCESNLFASAVNAGQATWCFEFWLNRYQILLGAVVAVAAAWVAWWIGMRQLRSADEGLTIARRQSAASVLDHLIGRRKLIETAIGAARSCEEAIRGVDYRGVRRALSELKSAQANGQNPPRDKPDIVAITINDLRVAAAQIDSVTRTAEEVAQCPAITKKMRAALTRQALRAREVAAGAMRLADNMRLIPDAARQGTRRYIAAYDDIFVEIDNLGVEVEWGDGGANIELQEELTRLQYVIEATIAQIEGGPP
jgi:hypothetical protein